LKTLIDLDPKPQGGEWYLVLNGEEGTVKMVVLIDKEHPNLALFTHGGYSGIGNLFDPLLISYEEAKDHFTKEITELELSAVSEEMESLKNTVIHHMKDFGKEHFS